MRSLEELYTILYNDFKDSVAHLKFICTSIHALYASGAITEEELRLLLNNFVRNKPRKGVHEEYWKNPYYSAFCHNWFGNGVASTRLRTEFVKHLITQHIK